MPQYYNVYYQDTLLESVLTSRRDADQLVDEWVETCEEGSEGADYINYYIVMEEE